MSDSLFAFIVTLAILVGTLVWVPCQNLCQRCWRHIGRERSHLLAVVLLLPLALLVTGCALTTTAAPSPASPIPGTAISGVVFGGQQPITGSKVYLLAANPGGYGGASLSLLTTGNSTTSSSVDSVGAFATTAVGTGSFALSGDYDCTLGYTQGASTASGGTNLPGSEQVYLYITGGNSGTGTNRSIGLLAALGPCNSIYSNTITVNELTTVAAAYALAGYATDALHVGSSNSALARVGLANAGLNSSNLVALSTGLPVASSTGITRPVATLYTLSNILASCINGTSGNTNCSNLFGYTESGGAVGTTPAETATAAINLAHNPYPTAAGVTALYGLQPGTGAPFSGGLSAQPNDFTVGLSYTGGGVSTPYGIAIDGSGNAWTSNHGNNSISKFSSTGTAISGANGYSGGGLSGPFDITIDVSGNAWIANENNDSISEFSSTGIAISSGLGYTGGGLTQPTGIAIDGAGNVWASNPGYDSTRQTYPASISKFSSSGTALSGTNGYTGGGTNGPRWLAIDASGNVWVANISGSDISEFRNNGIAISPSGGYYGGGTNVPFCIAIDGTGGPWYVNENTNANSVTRLNSSGVAVSPSGGYIGGGQNSSYAIALDGSGNAWIANAGVNTVSEISNAGTALSGPNGYAAGASGRTSSIAVDGSGDVWSGSLTSVSELIGAATPTVTPLPANLSAPYNAAASKP